MGLSQESIAGLIRCSPRTLGSWIAQGRRAIERLEEGEDIPLEDEKFVTLVLDGAEQKASLEQGLVATLLHHAIKKKNPQTALAVLERLFPNWRLKTQLEIGEIGEASEEKAAALVREAFGQHGAIRKEQYETNDGGAEKA